MVIWPTHVIIPVVETPVQDRSKEPSAEPSAQPSTPVKPGNVPGQNAPVNSIHSPIRSTSNNEGSRLDQSLPVNPNNNPVRSTFLNAGSYPYEIRIPTSEITDHGELVQDRQRRQQERAVLKQRKGFGKRAGFMHHPGFMQQLAFIQYPTYMQHPVYMQHPAYVQHPAAMQHPGFMQQPALTQYAASMQRGDHTQVRATIESSEIRERSSSDASKWDVLIVSDDDTGRLKRSLSGTSEDRESPKRHKSVPEGEEEALIED